MAPPGRRRGNLSPGTILLGLFFLFSSTASAASAVLGVDLGTEYIKAALVKPGIPLEIVLTKDSKRKETSAVAFKPSKGGALPAGSFPERFYGGDAIALQGRFPGDVYPNLKHLLGVSSESDIVGTYKERYPALEVTGTEGRKTVSFQSGVFSEDKSYTVEELLAMELKNVRENAKALAGKGYDIQDVVFTVPAFYTVDERRALEIAARLAGLKVLSVVSDGLAVGLNYATGRTFPDVTKDGKPEINLVFDMGAGSLSATILKFQGRTVKDVGRRNKTIQEVQVMGTGWDRTLGGDALNSLIVDDMVATFVELPAAKSASFTADKVKTHGRTAAKLFKEAERVRQMLSANKETTSFFESFYEDVDFRYKLPRARFEELAATYAQRIDGPINRALEAAGLTFADIDSVIVHGGASRTPFVQARLEAVAGKSKIRANVNADEAAVFGAAFKAAGLSPSFRVKEIRDSDTQGYNHGYQYMFNMKDRDQKIFTPSTKLGATKDLPFQMMGEFEFTMYQAIPGANGEVSKEPTLHFQSGNLTQVVTNMINDDKCDRDSFNNYVQVRLSPVTGTPEVLSAWVTCETESEEVKGGIVDGVKNLFGMGGKKDQEPLKESESSSSSSASKSSSKSSSSSSSAGAESTDAAKAGEKKIKTIRSAITYDVEQLGYKKFPRKELKRMQDRLAAFDSSDKSRRVREEVLNSLEAFTYRARDYIEDESFIGASTSAVRSTLETTLEAASEWMYSGGADADEKTLRSKLKELEDIVNPVLKRKDEASKRPDAIKELKDTIAHIKEVEQLVNGQIKTQSAESSKSSEAVSKASAAAAAPPSPDPRDELDDEADAPAAPEITEVPTVYTEDDLKTVQDYASKAQAWLDENEAKQSKLTPTDDPAFTVKDILAEKKKLDDVVMDMMMKKMKHFKPPTQSSKSKTTKAKATKSKAKKSATKTKKATKETEKPAAAEHPHPDSQQQVEDMENGDIKHQAHGGEAPSQQEIEEALRKAGIYAENAEKKEGREGGPDEL
ncbi:hypothetical protein AA0111_g1625 [Alternaria arborescens]|uniref:hypothetical protein n=1 Tax=Alternaria arborescens TaxID=156630 RepID=UPI0010750F0D|nr:hypothetical protein AA0111_g1625 [Alternaria arborescens]RYO39712.1 hypothetical protein AA0111_g1625 [Alternaria arborescens]